MDDITAQLRAAQAARARAVGWLLDHVGADGEPADAAERNGWSRLGWGLAVAGEAAAAASVVRWIDANRIAEDGGFRSGRLLGQGYIAAYPNYWLGTYVISCWAAGRVDLAMRTMAFLGRQQDPATGGLPMARDVDGAAPVCDMLSTAQVGLSALVTGEHEIAEKCAHWVQVLAEQTAETDPRFHACRQGDALWTEPDPAFAWAAIADFSQARQAYYTPAMGAVFLARYAARNDCAESLAAARRLVAYNLRGHPAQFDDLESVQACKFGWAVGELALVDREADWIPWVGRMIGWFLDRQAPDGSWGPSRFADPAPTIADRLVKTSEHLMELSVCMAALGASRTA